MLLGTPGRAIAVGLTLAIQLALAALARPALAETAGCDSGVLCRDDDGDGFPACGCESPTSPCDCDDADPKTYPGAPEACDETTNRNCNAGLDQCAATKICFQAVCTPRCIPLDDFGCAPGSNFFRLPDGACVCKPEDCALFGCPPGFTCDDEKRCVANCHDGVRCPVGQRCRGFGCVDPCAGIVCAEGATCEEGRCVPRCTCAEGDLGCPEGTVCDRSVPTCVDRACAGVRCTDCTHCEQGRCVDDCEGVVCPPKQVCRKTSTGARSCGACVNLCSPNPCEGPDTCDWRTGACIPPSLPEGGLAPLPGGSDALLVEGAGGFSCSAGGIAGASALTALGTGALVALLALRRRRRS